jgi:hypothetical protein
VLRGPVEFTQSPRIPFAVPVDALQYLQRVRFDTVICTG